MPNTTIADEQNSEISTSPRDIARARTSLALRARSIARLQSSSTAYIDHLDRIHSLYNDNGTNRADEITPLVLSVTGAATIERPDWLIDDILPSNALCFLYGREGAGKSFTALDMAFAVATGEHWLHFATRQGPVIYCTAEGTYGLGNRVRGYLQVKDKAGLAANGPLYLIPEALPLHADIGQRQLCLALRSILPDRPILLIIDTFHAYTAGADENSAKDMGLFLAFANHLRQLLGCTILIIHHARKNPSVDGSTAYRGHSCLAGVADTMVYCRKSNDTFLTLSCEKQKDAEAFTPIQLALTPVSLPDGETTCTVTPCTKVPSSTEVALAALSASTAPIRYTDWLRATSLPARKFEKARRRLVDRGKVMLDSISGLYSTVQASTPAQPLPSQPIGASLT